MNRPQPSKPSAMRLIARGVLRAPETLAVSCPASIPRWGRNSPALNGWGAHKGVRQRGEAGGNRRGRRRGAAGPAEAGLPQPVRRRYGLRGFGAGRAGGLQATRGDVRGVWASGTPARPAGGGGRGGNALGVSGTALPRPPAQTQVFSASRSPPQGRGGPRCTSVTCSGRLRPCSSHGAPTTRPATLTAALTSSPHKPPHRLGGD